jgi:hypothetical protein
MAHEKYIEEVNLQPSINWTPYTQTPQDFQLAPSLSRMVPTSLPTTTSNNLFDQPIKIPAKQEPQGFPPTQPTHISPLQTSLDPQLSSIPAPDPQQPQPPQPIPIQPLPPHPHSLKRKRGRPRSQPEGFSSYRTREDHLQKGRQAAQKCRERKKDYVRNLENLASEATTRNEALKETVTKLREEVLSLKDEVLRHAGCGVWSIDEYIAQCAGQILKREGPKGTFASMSVLPAMQRSEAQSQQCLTISPVDVVNVKPEFRHSVSLPIERMDGLRFDDGNGNVDDGDIDAPGEMVQD